MALTHVPGTLTFAAGDAEGSVIVWSLIDATKVSEWQLHASEILFLTIQCMKAAASSLKPRRKKA